MIVLIMNGAAESGKGKVAEYLRELFKLNVTLEDLKEEVKQKFKSILRNQ